MTSGNTSRLRVARPGDPPARLPLNQAAAMAVDSAELFAYSLDGEELTSDGGLRAAYLLGLAEAHLVSLVAILRAVTT
jgi:hypothetical protein